MALSDSVQVPLAHGKLKTFFNLLFVSFLLSVIKTVGWGMQTAHLVECLLNIRLKFSGFDLQDCINLNVKAHLQSQHLGDRNRKIGNSKLALAAEWAPRKRLTRFQKQQDPPGSLQTQHAAYINTATWHLSFNIGDFVKPQCAERCLSSLKPRFTALWSAGVETAESRATLTAAYQPKEAKQTQSQGPLADLPGTSHAIFNDCKNFMFLKFLRPNKKAHTISNWKRNFQIGWISLSLQI